MVRASLRRWLPLLLFCVVSCGRCQAQTLSAALAAWQSGKYEQAEAGLARLAPRDPAARLAYAQLLIETGKYAEAESAARGGNGDPNLAIALSDALRLQGKYEEAEAAVAKSALAAGNFAYAELLSRRGQKAAARQLYEAVSQGARKDLVSNLAVAQSLQRLGDFHGSNTLFQDLLDQYPESTEVRLAWGELFLEKYNAAEATGLYEEVLKKNPAQPWALLGMARCIADPADPQAGQYLEKALSGNPNLVEVFQLRAARLIEEEQYEEAGKQLALAEKIDAQNLETWSLQAGLAYLTRADHGRYLDRITSVNSGYGPAWLQLGELCASQKRFEEASGFYRKAIEADPDLWQAHASLGINLLRLGEEREGKEALERAYAGDPFHVWTVNTLRLLDSFKNYRESETAHFRLRIHSREEVLRELAEDLLEKSYQSLAAHYDYVPPFKTSIEFFPGHEDFAVRTLGVPGLGALGATFGKVVALDSPMARERGEYNWGATLWHEVAHIFALSLSDQKVPRWVTEGLSTYEESLARPGWGRALDPGFVQAAAKGRLLPLKDLSSGFVRPRFPDQVIISYVQGSLVCRYLVEQYGWEKIRQLLRLFRDKNEPDAFQEVYGRSLEQLDTEFQQYLKPRLARVSAQANPESLSDYQDRVKEGEKHFDAGQWADAVKAYKEAIALEQEPRYPVNVFYKLAEAEEQMGAEQAAMQNFLKAGQLMETAEEAYRRAFDLAVKLGEQETAGIAYENLLFLYPADAELHMTMGESWLRWNRPAEAVAPLKRMTRMPGTDLAQAHYLLARAYLGAGKRDLARKAALAALDTAPTFEKAQQLLLQIAEEHP